MALVSEPMWKRSAAAILSPFPRADAGDAEGDGCAALDDRGGHAGDVVPLDDGGEERGDVLGRRRRGDGAGFAGCSCV